MNHPHQVRQSSAPKAPPSPYVEVTFVFRDLLQKPIEGLSVRLIAGAGAPPAPAWKYGPDSDDPADALASAPDGASAPVAGSPAQVPNRGEGATDASGYLVTIQNAARNQPIDVLVKNRRGDYVWKATVTPKKDVSAFTITSPEYHLEATTKLTPKEEFEQDLNLPVVKPGEVMTIERLVNEFGPYIGWSQKVTEQGRVKKDFPAKKNEVTEGEQTHKKKTSITIEHHYKVVDTGKPTTVALNVLGSRLNYPATTEIRQEAYAQAAKTLGCEVAAIEAVAMKETKGAAFLSNGLPAILYERQAFFKSFLPKDKWWEPISKLKKESNPFPKFPNLCFPTQGGYSDGKKDDGGWPHADGATMYQYERFVRACALNVNSAIMACSWGAFQVMGLFYEDMGYASPLELANSVMRGVDEQFKLFVAYIGMNKNAKNALQRKDWDSFALYYNGGSYPATYPADLKKYYEKFR